jgi:hypothetical protein
MEEPGLDRHEWETQWENLADRLVDDPAAALGDLDDLIARMLEAHGLPLEESERRTDAEPELVREFLAARLIARRIDAGEDVGPGNVGFAVGAYRDLYETLLGSGLA